MTLLLAGPASIDSSHAAPREVVTSPQQQGRLWSMQLVDAPATRIPNTMHYGGTYPSAVVPKGRGFVRSQAISCVPYARQVSGIMVIGNAWQWWRNAAGQYARGDRPEAGSVLNFRSNYRMPLGHVAVVDYVVNAREIVIEHANWPSHALRGPVMRGVRVVDVSEANNWSAVRVELTRRGEFGAVYPTYGFIYNRPDPGTITASVQPPAPQPAINPVSSDLRPRAEQPWRMTEQVGEARPVLERVGLQMAR